ncbi:hypothetical protein TrRE_jg5014 [Triparma retinervis]|uniref:Uncharacterized protein n=1 Tax=Triparma retinervis TaxID=2557542 RepID=A0A9W7F5J4_9STRA|nr:hypothetical protein TrRE_jg5014 [Triparma retinervis]
MLQTDNIKATFTGPDRSAAGVLGAAVSWLFCNRPAHVHVELDSPELPNKVTLAASPIDSFNGQCDPEKAIDIFHIHAHFDTDSEAAAIQILESTAGAVRRSGEVPLHQHLWHEKNGPHDPWSWELWVERPAGLGAALLHFMRTPIEGKYLRLAAHADTGQEYTDHSTRLCWVGPPDDLDIDFFPPPSGSYSGPKERVRETNAENVVTMGEKWRRNKVDGAVALGKKYGAQDRTTKRAILVTGGNSGIGFGLCMALAAEGCKVYLGARSTERGERAVAEIKEAVVDADVSFVKLDVTDPSSIRAAVEIVPSLFGLVNNAGVGLGTSDLKATDQDYLLACNLYGSKNVTEAFVHKIEDGGSVLSVGSGSAALYIEGSAGHNKGVASREQKDRICSEEVTWADVEDIVRVERDSKWAGGGGRCAYALSKAALAALNIIWARENERLMCVCCYPGFVDSNMTKGMLLDRTRISPADASVVMRKCLYGEGGVKSGMFVGPDGKESALNKARGNAYKK